MRPKRKAAQIASNSIQKLARQIENNAEVTPTKRRRTVRSGKPSSNSSPSAPRSRPRVSSTLKVPGGERAREGYLFEQAVVKDRMKDFQIEEPRKGADFDGIDHKWGLDVSVKKKNLKSSMSDLESFLRGKIKSCRTKTMLSLEFASMKRVTGYTRPFSYVFQFKGEKESILVWGYARDGVHMFLSYAQVAELYRKICEGCGVGFMTNFKNENRSAVGKVCTRACRRIDGSLPDKYAGLLSPRSKISRPKREKGIAGQVRLQTVVDFCKLLRLNPTFVFMRVPNTMVNASIPTLRENFNNMMRDRFGSNSSSSWTEFTQEQLKERKIWIEQKMAQVGMPSIWTKNSFLEYTPTSAKRT